MYPTTFEPRSQGRREDAADPGPAVQTDWREQPYNTRACGPVEAVATAADLITTQHTVVVDIDLKYVRPECVPDGPGTGPARLYQHVVKTWLDRHPLGNGAEVRDTGSGLHVLFRIRPAVEFPSTAERDRWAAVWRTVQASLPSDPNAPGLTILTRPVGSVNSKTGSPVTRLREGDGVSPEEVLAFAQRLCERPFATLCDILYGPDRITPCPVCRADGSSLGVGARAGQCYARCGRVSVARLLDTVMADPGRQEVARVPA